MGCRGTAEEKAGGDGVEVAAQPRTSTGVRSHINTIQFAGETDNLQIGVAHLGYISQIPMRYLKTVKR